MVEVIVVDDVEGVLDVVIVMGFFLLQVDCCLYVCEIYLILVEMVSCLLVQWFIVEVIWCVVCIGQGVGFWFLVYLLFLIWMLFLVENMLWVLDLNLDLLGMLFVQVVVIVDIVEVSCFSGNRLFVMWLVCIVC